MPKVLISDKMSSKALEVFSRYPEIEVDIKIGMTPDELKAVVGQYDGLAIRSATKVKADIIAAATNLKVIGRAGIGVDNVDIPEASKKGIVVMNTPFGNTVTTAEHAISMMLSLAREIPEATASTKAAKWEKSRFMGVEITGKTLGVIGTGNIGSIVVDRAQGLKMDVIAYDPFISQERAEQMGITLVDLDEFYGRADFISIHTPLTDTTRNMINAEAFKKMKEGVLIINCARGGIINETDLAEAIKSKKVRGAALDVFEKEPVDADNPLLSLPQVICSPHLGASTDEAQENVAIQVAEQIAEYLTKGIVKNALNIPSVSSDELPKLQPYLTLAEKLGSTLGQLSESGMKKVIIEYSGEVSEFNLTPVTTTILKSLLEPILQESVNLVNAPLMAKERGVEVVEMKSSEAQSFNSLIKVTLVTDKRDRSVAGTLFHHKEPRIVQIDGIDVETIPTGNILFIYNEDKPGIIGNVGSLLGDANVNIASFQLGRDLDKKRAVSMVNVDEKVSDKTLAHLRDLADILEVKQVTL
ncbi:MAG: phosphoglycerate dehydrogenase [Proteobacteria bacterium]|nr:phosphoglycerate dehydrogenase [Pseudomonadota bacterium]